MCRHPLLGVSAATALHVCNQLRWLQLIGTTAAVQWSRSHPGHLENVARLIASLQPRVACPRETKRCQNTLRTSQVAAQECDSCDRSAGI